VEDELYKSIDKNYILKPVAYCKTHHAYLSKKQMKVHQCVKKGCTGLEKIDCYFWQERERKRNEARKRKNGARQF